MPGVLIVEALAQVGAVAVLMQEENKGKLGYFGGIKNCKFRRKVVPGDKLKLEAKIIRHKGKTTGNRRSCCISGWRSCSKGRVVSDDREGGNR